ncbi:Dimethylsulfoniopropionate utilization transcriptional regulator [Caballeronia sordidicola]|uniref:Dimethylsulfoniopropionate utilization transcriptional regulator n=2 Tax=Caballeronia sordidicola TaxID=196367 RepID=A0A226X7I6_CABSO|nr:Dimethylsulfoniopropionate utilization transcriptional regulator [Caballeronia sordidicola]
MEIRHENGKWAGFKAERLTWDSLFPVCASFLPSDKLPLSTPNDLAHHELLHVLGYEEGWGYWLKKVGADHVDSSQGLQFDTLISALKMAELGVRREKAALSSGCKPRPATAPAGSNRSSYGGNEMAEAFG